MFKKLSYCFVLLIPAMIFLIVWEVAAIKISKFSFLFGSPTLIFGYLKNYIFSSDGIVDFFVTMSEALGGFVAGNLLGIILGLILAYSPTIQKIVKPYMIILGAIPIFALAPIMIMWFGVGYFSKFMMAVLSTLFITAEHAYSGAIETNNDYLTLLKSFGATRWQVFKKAMIPSSLTWVITSFRLTISFALLGAFIGEYISSNRGLGYRILKSSGLYNIPGVLGGIFLIVILAFFFRLLINFLIKIFIPWHKEMNGK